MWHINHQATEVFQQETQAAARKIMWKRHRPKKGFTNIEGESNLMDGDKEEKNEPRNTEK